MIYKKILYDETYDSSLAAIIRINFVSGNFSQRNSREISSLLVVYIENHWQRWKQTIDVRCSVTLCYDWLRST